MYECITHARTHARTRAYKHNYQFNIIKLITIK